MNIKNKTLAIIGITSFVTNFFVNLLRLLFLENATDGIKTLSTYFDIFISIIFITFVITASIRLWNKYKFLIIFFILMLILYASIDTSYFLINLINFILFIKIINRLFKLDKTDKEFIYPKKEGDNIFIGIFGLIFTILFILGWILNVINFFRLDFKEPFKAEVMTGIGILMFPIGSVIGYMPIKE